MKDYLGRELNKGDLVVVKKNKFLPFECGIFVGDHHIRTAAGIREYPEQVALIANPDAKEMEIKQNILDMMLREQTAVACGLDPKKASTADEIGRVYRMAKSDDVVVYCGKRVLNLIINGNDYGTTRGHYYMVMGNLDDSVIASMTWDDCVKKADERIRYNDCHKVSRTLKQYAKAYQKLEVPESFVVEHAQRNAFDHVSTTRAEFSLC